MTLSQQNVKVNRGMIRKTFDIKGLPYVSELVKQNLDDTLTILKWNILNNIFVYRFSSDSFPWMSEYNFCDLPDFTSIKEKLENIGNFIKTNNIRISYHPGPFNVLSSLNPTVVNKTIIELNKHAELMDLMLLDKTTYYPINIHIGTTKPDLQTAMGNFCTNFNRLSESCKSRLTVENDDSLNKFSVKDLYESVYKSIGIPIVFDQFHFICGKQDQTLQQALELSLSTWKTIPLTHMSSSKKLEIVSAKKTAHADYIYEDIETFGHTFDIELECKQKELGVLRYFTKV